MDGQSILWILIPTAIVYFLFKLFSDNTSGTSAASNDNSPSTIDSRLTPQIFFKAVLRALKTDPDIKIDHLDENNFEIGAYTEQKMSGFPMGILIKISSEPGSSYNSKCTIFVKQKYGIGPYANSETRKRKSSITLAIKSELLSI